jgi:hypothetical protein
MERNGTDKKLTPRQMRAVEAMMSEPTSRAAAKKARIGVTTLYRWLASPTFADALREARAQTFERTMAGLSAASETAVEVLREIMSEEAAAARETASVRVRAARVALGAMLRAHSMIETEERLRGIEAQLKAIEDEQRASTPWTN